MVASLVAEHGFQQLWQAGLVAPGKPKSLILEVADLFTHPTEIYCGNYVPGNELAIFMLFKMEALGFPGGAVVGSPPANAGDTGSIPGPERSHMPQKQLSPCTTTTEPVL